MWTLMSVMTPVLLFKDPIHDATRSAAWRTSPSADLLSSNLSSFNTAQVWAAWSRINGRAHTETTQTASWGPALMKARLSKEQEDIRVTFLPKRSCNTTTYGVTWHRPAQKLHVRLMQSLWLAGSAHRSHRCISSNLSLQFLNSSVREIISQ